jgi:hypothetical protein
VSGSAEDFIASLPGDGCVCIVHSHAIVSEYRAAIARGRGADVAAVTRVIAAPTLRDEVAATDGLSLPVFRDPFVDVQRDHRRALMQGWRL